MPPTCMGSRREGEDTSGGGGLGVGEVVGMLEGLCCRVGDAIRRWSQM